MNNIRILGKSKIYNDDYVIKKKNKDIKYLYDYLNSSGFNSYPELLDEYENTYKYRYIEKKKDSSIEDVLLLLGDLHNKTISYTKLDQTKLSFLYETLLENISDREYFYEKILNNIENDEFNSPSEYLLIRNSSILLSSIKESKNMINNWYKSIKEKNEIRVSINHGNPTLSHIIISDEPYLINFDKYSIDNPVLDIYKLYVNENYNIDVVLNINKYVENNSLDEEEETLLKALFIMPYKVKFSNNQLQNTNEIRRLIDNIYSLNNYILKDKII